MSYMERVVLQVAQQRLREWQLLGTFCVSVDGKAHQVLQSWEGLWFVQGVHQFQRDSTVFSCGLDRVRLCFVVNVIRRLVLWYVA